MRYTEGDWSLVEYDFHTKRQVWQRENPDGSTTIRTDYHVDDIMDAAKSLRNETQGQKYGDWRKIASVPLSLHYQHLQAAQHQSDDRYIDRWLSENESFKTFR